MIFNRELDRADPENPAGPRVAEVIAPAHEVRQGLGKGRATRAHEDSQAAARITVQPSGYRDLAARKIACIMAL
ncbi:MAG: hypothetical protein ACOYLV_12070 [Rubrivivax sp.]